MRSVLAERRAEALTEAAMGQDGVARNNRQIDRLYDDNVRTIVAAADLSDALHELEISSLQLISADESQARAITQTQEDLVFQAQQALAELREVADETQGLVDLDHIDAGLVEIQELRRSGAYVSDGTERTSTQIDDLAVRTNEVFEPITSAVDRLSVAEAGQADLSKREAERDYRSSQWRLGLSAVISLLAGLIIVLVLTRNVVPRIRGYSRFAMDIADGRPTTVLRVRGSDELAELGAALNVMADQRWSGPRAVASTASVTLGSPNVSSSSRHAGSGRRVRPLPSPQRVEHRQTTGVAATVAVDGRWTSVIETPVALSRRWCQAFVASVRPWLRSALVMSSGWHGSGEEVALRHGAAESW